MQKAMSKKLPSIPQLQLLAKLGVQIIPTTMAEASVLINQAKEEKNVSSN